MTTPETKKESIVTGIIFGLLLGAFLTFAVTGGHLSFDAIAGVFCGFVAALFVTNK